MCTAERCMSNLMFKIQKRFDMVQMFYIQDSRSYVGNDILWWCPAGRGYTTDLSKAGLYTLEEAQAQHNCRHTDIPWPKEYIEVRTRPAVDVQYVNRSEALEGSGVTIVEPKKAKESQTRSN